MVSKEIVQSVQRHVEEIRPVLVKRIHWKYVKRKQKEKDEWMSRIKLKQAD